MGVKNQARSWAALHHPDAAIQRVAAFSNAVAYLVTGGSGGYGGPSIREHLVSHAIAPDHPSPGNWEFNAACEFAAPICFGPIDLAAALTIQQREHCFDDDPADLAALRRYEAGRAIAEAWLAADYLRALSLTNRWQVSENVRLCAVCGKVLASQARGDYCAKHRSRDPARVMATRRRKKSKSE